MPRAVSILNIWGLPGLLILCVFSAFPDTADTGDTLEARLAGEFDAINTVIPPTIVPHKIPITLTPNKGMVENSPATPYRKKAHSPHVMIIPNTTPTGTAVLHQLRASNLTNLFICFLLIPIQRIIPKNFVL